LKRYPLNYIVWVTISLAIFIIGFYLATDFGNALRYSSDSYQLKSIAENFGKGNGLVAAGGQELIYWGPLYPIILSAWYHEIDLFALLINFFSIIGVFVLSQITFKRELEGPSAKLIYTSGLLLSTPLLMIAVFFWTETLFLFLLVLFCYGLINYLDTNKKKYLIIWIIAGWLMLVLRNAGIFFIPGAVMWILLQKEKKLYDKLSFLLILVVISSGFISWNIYKLIILSNINVISELLPVFTPGRNLELITNEIGKYFVPDIGFYFSNLVGAGIIARVIYVAINFSGKSISVAYFMVLTYIFTFLIIPPSPSDISRYLAPVIPVIFIVVSGFGSYVLASNKLNPWLSKMIVISVYFYFVLRIIKNITVWAQIDIYNYFKFV